MKTNYKLLMTIFAGLLLISSCSKKSNITEVIPQDSKAVIIFDVQSIFKKSDLLNIKDFSFFNTVITEIENEGKDEAEFINNFISNPSKSGIDLFGDIYMYYVPKTNTEVAVSVAIPLSNSDKFSNWISDFLESYKFDFTIEESKGYKYVEANKDKIKVAWKDSYAILVFTDDGTKAIDIVDELMNLKKSEQISSIEEYNTFSENKKDISIYLDYSILQDLQSLYIKNNYKIAGSMGIDLDKMKIMSYIEFLKGEIKISSQTILPDDNTIEQLTDADFNAELLKYSPNKTILSASEVINIQAFQEFINKIPSFIILDPQLKEQTGYHINELINTLGGSGFFNLYGFKKVTITDNTPIDLDDFEVSNFNTEIQKTIPLFTLVIDIKNIEVLNTFAEMFKIAGMISAEKDYYIFDDRGVEYYIAYNENILMATSDKKIIEQFGNGGLADNYSSLDNANTLIASTSYFKLNLNSNEFSNEILEEFGISDTQQTNLFLDTWNNIFEYVEFVNKSTNGEITVLLKEDDENSLALILHSLDKLSQKAL